MTGNYGITGNLGRGQMTNGIQSSGTQGKM